MILRRLSQSLKEQNWAAIWIEFVLLILGVFLGIQVANWNEERQQDLRQHEYIKRLQVDFIGSRDRMQQHLITYQEADRGGDLILSLLETEQSDLSDKNIAHEDMQSAFNALIQSRNPPSLPATYVEMLSDGQLSRIKNPELRNRLSEYDRLLGISQESSRMINENTFKNASILQRYFSTRTIMDAEALSGIREELIAYDLKGMRADPEFVVSVRLLRRASINSMAIRQKQINLADQVLVLLEKEQKK